MADDQPAEGSASPGKLKLRIPTNARQKLVRIINKAFVPSFLVPGQLTTPPGRDPQPVMSSPSLALTTDLALSGLMVPNSSHHSLHYARSATSLEAFPAIQISQTNGDSLQIQYQQPQQQYQQQHLAVDSNTVRGRLYSCSSDTAPYNTLQTRRKDRDSVLGENESALDCFAEGRGDRVDFVEMMPSEIVLHIFQYLDTPSLAACCEVSRSWLLAAESDSVWRHLYKSRNWSSTLLPDNLNWQGLYRVRQQLESRWVRGQVTPRTLAGHTDSIYCVQFDKDKIVTGSKDRSIKIWSASTGNLLRTLEGTNERHPPQEGADGLSHTGSVLCLAFDDQILVSGSSDSSCIIWLLPKFKPVKRVFRHSRGVLDVRLHSDFIVSCSRDGTISIWDRQSPSYALKHRLRGHRGPVNALSVHNQYIFSAGGDGLVKMWDSTTGEALRDFRGHIRGLACAQVSEDGRYVVSGGNDKTIRVWDMKTGECLHVLEGHKSLVRSLHITGQKIVSASYDQTIQVWDLETGRPLANLAGWHGSWIFCARADPRRIISTSVGTKPVILDFSEGLDKDYLNCITG